MRIRKLVAGGIAAAALAGTVAIAAPANAATLTPGSIASIAAGSLADNGGAPTDSNWYDFDILANAAVALDLLGALDTTPNLTVFAPNDRAFQVLVASLGGGWRNEAGVLAFLTDTTKVPTQVLLTTVLYHVLPERLTASQLVGRTNQATLAGVTIKGFTRVPFTNWVNVVDNDPNAVNGLAYKSIPASNGIIHVTAFVLRPVDLPPVAR